MKQIIHVPSSPPPIINQNDHDKPPGAKQPEQADQAEPGSARSSQVIANPVIHQNHHQSVASVGSVVSASHQSDYEIAQQIALDGHTEGSGETGVKMAEISKFKGNEKEMDKLKTHLELQKESSEIDVESDELFSDNIDTNRGNDATTGGGHGGSINNRKDVVGPQVREQAIVMSIAVQGASKGGNPADSSQVLDNDGFNEQQSDSSGEDMFNNEHNVTVR